MECCRQFRALDVAWYGTSFFDGQTIPDNYPASAAWYVFFAQNLGATSGGAFAQAIATPIVHYGGVCESGATCTGNRDLFDDFGIAASPTTGLASIIHSDDQYTNTPNEPTVPGCSPNQSNTINCDRTNIATQISGPGINQKPGACQGEEDFEQLNTNNVNNPNFGVSEECGDSGNHIDTRSVESIDVRINGLSLAMSWTPSLPVSLATVTSLTAYTTIMPLGFVPTVGSVYQTTITTTLSDGTIQTQTPLVIYTLGAGIGL